MWRQRLREEHDGNETRYESMQNLLIFREEHDGFREGHAGFREAHEFTRAAKPLK
jgi:hypothetical protein